MARRSERVATLKLAAYLEDEVTASERALIEADLEESSELRKTLGTLTKLRDALSAPLDEFEDTDLVPALGRALENPPVVRLRGKRRIGLPVVSVVAVCAAAGAGFLLRGHEVGEFRAKSAVPTADPGQRWAGVVAYEFSGTGVPTRLGQQLPASHGLMFSYTNLGPKPFGYLMIFGQDALGQVRWFHPAYERPDTNPASIPIRGGAASVALAELIQHDLPAGTFTLHALFTMRPLHVVEMEALLARDGASALDELPDATHQLSVTTVAP